jgi:hypothetical protein
MDHRVNKAPVDRWTTAHFAAGCIGGATNIDPLLFMLGAVGWEILERELKKNKPSLFPDPSSDSLENSVCDVLAAGVGFGLIRRQK